MASKKLVPEPSKCTGCHSCEVWCSHHHFQVSNPSLARLRIVTDEGQGVFTPETCYHCEDPWCMNACPSEAITRDPDTGAVVIEDDLCTLCLICVDACPFEAIKIAPDGSVYKCDLCQGNPDCVWSCTREALTYQETTPEYREQANARAGKAGGKV